MKNLIITTGIAILCTLLSAWQYGVNSIVMNGAMGASYMNGVQNEEKSIVMEIPKW